MRYAEAIYFSNQLGKVLEKSGAWGAIRVTPNSDVIMDLYISGTIYQSDGETMDLEITATDSSGKKWFSKRYKQTTGKYAYDRRLKSLGDPFQNLFIRIANDLLSYREKKISDQRAAELRTISELRFAKQFSPEAFDSYINENRKGILTDRPTARGKRQYPDASAQNTRARLPLCGYHARLLRRLLPADAPGLSGFSPRLLRLSGPRTTAKPAGQQDRLSAVLAPFLAGIYGRSQARTGIADDAGTATAAVGGFVLKAGLDKKQKASEFNESVAEMGSSLEAEIAPQVIELEDRTVTLTGTVQAQYQQWQELLGKIYQQERATP